MRGRINQVDNVITLLERKSTTRRAVIQLFNAEDIASEHREIPCTTTMQFIVRDEKLNLLVTMRSNDAVKGLPHDIFCFTMLQEMMAVRLSKKLGYYKQFVGSMHIYDADTSKAEAYLNEGFHRTVEMPTMPDGDPFRLITSLLDAERKVRSGEAVDASAVTDEPYWADVVRLLQAYYATGDVDRLNKLKDDFVAPIYKEYLQGRMDMSPLRPDIRTEPDLGI
jgi:thymidylate synthase